MREQYRLRTREDENFDLATLVQQVEEAAVARNVILDNRSFWTTVEAAAAAGNVLPDRRATVFERHYCKFVRNLKKH